MIVTYNKTNRHVIPQLNGIDQVLLYPGSQEIANSDWYACRHYILDMIENGIIEEEWTKVGVDARDADKQYMLDDPDDPKNKRYPAILKDKNKNEARKIVEKCTHVPTLLKWNQEELRPEVSLAIVNQLKKSDRDTSRDYKAMEQQILNNYSAKR